VEVNRRPSNQNSAVRASAPRSSREMGWWISVNAALMAATATVSARNAAQAGPAGKSKYYDAASASDGTRTPRAAATMKVARMLDVARSAAIAGSVKSANVERAPIS